MGASTLAYEIGEHVWLKDAGKKALIQQILFSFDGVQYQVAYWDDSVRRIEWVFPCEIKKIARVRVSSET